MPHFWNYQICTFWYSIESPPKSLIFGIIKFAPFGIVLRVSPKKPQSGNYQICTFCNSKLRVPQEASIWELSNLHLLNQNENLLLHMNKMFCHRKKWALHQLSSLAWIPSKSFSPQYQKLLIGPLNLVTNNFSSLLKHWIFHRPNQNNRQTAQGCNFNVLICALMHKSRRKFGMIWSGFLEVDFYF